MISDHWVSVSGDQFDFGPLLSTMLIKDWRIVVRHIDVTRYLHLFTIFDIQFSVTPLFLSRTRRPTHNSLRALTVRRCHRHGLRHDDFDLWILSRGMVWSHADHREGIHWCPAHQCHLCGAYPLAISDLHTFPIINSVAPISVFWLNISLIRKEKVCFTTIKGWCWVASSWPSSWHVFNRHDIVLEGRYLRRARAHPVLLLL